MRTDFLKIFFLRAIGNFLVLSAVAGVVLTFAPVVGAEIAFRRDQFFGQQYVVAGDQDPCRTADSGFKIQDLRCPGKTTFVGLLSIPEPLQITPLDSEFGIVIPKIAANARVIANVDAGSYDDYIEALRHGVAHAKGTVFPGQVGNSFLFAHSVGNFWEVNRWNAVFYLLRELRPGDEVDLFYKNQRYTYVVYDQKVVEPTDVSYLSAQANFPMLTMQTCWPPGTTLKRLLVFARLKNG